jgi:hypothetical protein
MKLADFYPYVVPHVPDLPTPTIDLHVRMAAHEFFRRTHAWQVESDPEVIADGVRDYDLSVPAGAQIVKVLRVVADDRDYAKAVRLIDGAILRFSADCLPNTGSSMVVTFAVTPRVGDIGKTWATFPDHLDDHIQDIALGAIATLLLTTPERKGDATAYGLAFSNRIATVGIKLSRSQTRARLGSGSAAQFF